MYVQLVQYYFQDLTNGEIRDDVFLYNDYKEAKALYDKWRAQIDKKTKNGKKVVEFERRGFYHTVVFVSDFEKVMFTIIHKRQKVKE